MGVLFLGDKTGVKHINIRCFKKCVAVRINQNGKKLNSLNYVFINDDELLELNRQFLKHNTYTDIITFDLSSNQLQIEAEIYISLDRVKENAIKFKTNTTDELLRVMFHGVLHLFGLKDKSALEKTNMRQAEADCLNLYRETLSAVSHENKQ